MGRSPAGGREEGLDRPRKDEDDGFLSACDEVLSNEGPDLWGFGQSEGRSPIADSATKDRVETALKVLSTMSPAEVQQRLNAEDLSTPIVSVKPKTQKKESTKKKLESVSPPHTYRRLVEEERRRQMFESGSIEGDDTDEELPVSQKRSLPAKSGPKKKAGLPKATASEIKDAALWSSSEEEGAVATPSGGQTKCLVKLTKYDGTTAFETFWAQFQNVVEYHQADFESLRHLKATGATRCWSTAEVPDCEQSVTTVSVGVPTTPFCRDRRRQSTGRYFTGDR